ncbi:MAG: GGDEF domain-containing protein [Pseudomonadota bacterium]
MQEDSRLVKLVLGNLAAEPEGVRRRLLATIPQSPPALVVTSITILLICITTVLIRPTLWTWFWLGISAVIVAWRIFYPALRQRLGHKVPLAGIMATSALLFITFGFGCAGSIATGDGALTAMSVAAVMGMVAGLATRWAALPRAAISTMAMTALPPVATLALQGGASVLAAMCVASVVTSVAAYTVQNHENLLAALVGEEVSVRLARTDHLTGLPNRIELDVRLKAACLALPSGNSPRAVGFALLYLDLDGFKSINDVHGHATGDDFLRRVAGCLRTTIGPDAFVARIGGDEFVILLPDADELAARAVSQDVIEAISREHSLPDGRRARVGCSVGLSLAPAQGREPEVLLARADAALYAVKNQGKGTTGVWRTLSS